MGHTTGPGSSTIGPLASPSRRHLALALALMAVAAMSAVGVGPADAAVHRLQLASPISDGPVYEGDFADPAVLVTGTTYYAYGTNAGEENLPVIESTDLVHWKAQGDALPILPPWAQTGFIWSPSVVADRGGGYELFFSAYDRTVKHQCIGRATAPSPLGPFVDDQQHPFLCQTALGGAIDPAVYSTHGIDYLVWKSDGEDGQPQEIWAQQLGVGDETLLGSPALLLVATQSWEDGIVEGPTLALLGNTLYLFFSGNKWTSANYAIGAVACSSALGPCASAGTAPVLGSTSSALGPGGPAIFHVGGEALMAYAAWSNNDAGTSTKMRELFLGYISVSSTGTVSISERSSNS